MQFGGVMTKPRRWLVLVPALVGLVLGSRLGQPSVFPDEMGALLNARHLAGLGPASPWWYLPGYGGLLLPLVALSDDPTVLVRGAQIVNAMLMVAGCLGLVVSLGLFVPSATERHRLQAASLAMLTPAYLYFSSFAIADNALVALSAWLAPATSWLSRARRESAIGAGVVGAALVTSMHSRAVLLPMAVAFGMVVSSPTLDRSLRAAALLFGAIGGRLLASATLDAVGGSALAGTGRQSFRALVGDNLSIEAISTLPGTLVGQVFAITIGSLGVVVLGVIHGWKLALVERDQRPAAAAIIAVVLGALVSSVLFTNGGTGDFALYSRYVEVVLPVVIALGWLGLIERTIRPPLVLAGALVIAGPALLLLRGSAAFDGRIQRLNVAGLAPYIRFGDGLQPVWLGLLGAGAVVVFSLAARVRPSGAVVIALAVFAIAAIDNVQASRAFVEAAGGPPAIASTIDDLAIDGCIALDQTGLEDFWFQENLRLHRLDLEMPFWPIDGDVPPCSDFVVSSRVDLDQQLIGWQPVAVEPAQVQWLWASPRALGDPSLEPLVEASLGDALVEPAGSIELTVVSASDQEMVVQLTILNSGDDVFVPASNLPGGVGGVQVGLEWRSATRPGERTMEPIRIALPGLLAPGERTTLLASIPRSDPTLDLVLRAELVQEGIGWIEAVSTSTLVGAGS